MTMDDRDLENAARRLGERAASRIDAQRIGGAVVERLRTARLTPWWATPAFRVAAVVVLALGVGIFYRPGPPNGTEVAVTLPEQLQTLSVDELQEVLDSLVIETPAPAFSNAGLADLDERQLTELLESLEG